MGEQSKRTEVDGRVRGLRSIGDAHQRGCKRIRVDPLAARIKVDDEPSANSAMLIEGIL
jgi:hypothetical protein